MYPQKFIETKYLWPIDILEDTITFKNLKSISKPRLEDLARLYMSIYNSDNIKLIKKYKFAGTTKRNGIWPEDPWNIDTTKKLLHSFISDMNTIAIYASAKDLNGEDTVIGLTAYKKTTYADFINRGYINPFKEMNLNDISLYYVSETIKRKVNKKDSTPIRHFSLDLKNAVNTEVCKLCKEALIYSSTNNKYMYEIFKKEGRTIVENKNSIWRKYQGYLYLKCGNEVTSHILDKGVAPY